MQQQNLVTGKTQNPRSKSQIPKTKGAGIFLCPAFYFIWFSLVAAAQESTYSADSLMAAFKTHSNISLKGTEITLTDIVAETKKSSVLFKSSGNGKVICELASPIYNGNTKLFVGSPLTVVGRVRGRGILGNVTLDDCSLALSVALSDTTRGSSEAIPDEPTAPEVFAEQSEAPTGNATESPLETRETDAIKPRASPISTKRLSPSEHVKARRPDADAIPSDRLSPRGIEQPNKVTGEASNSTKALLPVALYASLVALAGFALLAFVKSHPAFIPARLRTSPNRPVTQEMRRAALEALLSEPKKKK